MPMPVCNRFHERLANNNDFYEGYCSLMPLYAGFLEPRKSRLGPSKSNSKSDAKKFHMQLVRVYLSLLLKCVSQPKIAKNP